MYTIVYSCEVGPRVATVEFDMLAESLQRIRESHAFVRDINIFSESGVNVTELVRTKLTESLHIQRLEK